MKGKIIMDIYSFIPSSDVAEYCRKIEKTWNTYEMAAIIGKSDRTMTEKHAAWQELIENFPDMSVRLQECPFPPSLQIESVHKKLAEIMENELASLERSDTKKTKSDLNWSWCLVDIPVPFKQGDILISSYFVDEDEPAEYCFVLNSLDREDKERFKKRRYSMNYSTEAWGFFVNEAGALFGDHVESYENCVYYTGKLEGKNRLLHYVSLFLQDEIELPELLNMQCRIIMENLLSNNFNIDSHGCSIPEYLLAENRLSLDEQGG